MLTTVHDVELTAAGGAVGPPAWLDAGLGVVESDGRVVSANDALAAWFETTPSELRGQSLPKLLGRRHAPWEPQLARFLAGAAAFDRLELSSERSPRPERVSVELCCHNGTCVVRLESVAPQVRDFEELFPNHSWERVAANEAFQRLLRTEAQLDNVINHWPGIIFSQRPDFSFAFVSPKIEEWTGVPASEWRRRSKYFWQVVHEADAEALLARLQSKACFSPAGLTSAYRIRHSQTGRVSYLWEHRQAVQSSNGLLLGYEGIWLDITRQTIAERRLLNMCWKENLGTLTMGLAHDFCNIMTGIISLSETFEAEVADNPPLRNGLNLIRTTATEAGELSHRIRQLHLGIPGEKNYHDLNEVVSTLAGILRKVLPKRVRVETAFTEGQLPVYADAVELRQVVVNLALNAVDAMPNGGKLVFGTARHAEAPAAQNLLGTLPRLPLISLSVQDNGAGIPDCFLGSIFDPFFTTKPLGKGSGLGLYNARLFVEKHNAAISLETRQHVGTTFHLWFPQADFTEAREPEADEKPGRDTLLAIGPPGEALEKMVEFLRENDYYVVAVTTEADAIETLHAPDFQFTGVLLLHTAGHSESFSLGRRIEADNLPVKVILSPVGCNVDEVETSLVQRVDAVLPGDMPARDFLARLKTVLEKT
jgi:signal transduction histidine kinase